MKLIFAVLYVLWTTELTCCYETASCSTFITWNTKVRSTFLWASSPR